MVQDLFPKLTIQRLGLAVLLIISSTTQIAGQTSPASQQPSLQELKDKLQNIEREMTEVQDQIKALEAAKASESANVPGRRSSPDIRSRTRPALPFRSWPSPARPAGFR